MNQSASRIALGIDFGTTNTVIATSSRQGEAAVVPFTLQSTIDERIYSTFRSAMCFWEDENDSVRDLRFEAGPWAIERFIDDPTDCRFLQSFKTFAASPLFSDTFIHGRKFNFESLLAAFLEKLRAHAGEALAQLPKHLVMGRPVNFAGTNAKESLAIERYERALKMVGFEEITYVYEPVAAAYFFAQRLTKAATVLVADFGGGTSDFSIIRFEPHAGKLTSIPLSHSGVAVAGDVF
ncbi:MAG: Hsp70 family protein, partial [Casimicrobium sp.]